MHRLLLLCFLFCLFATTLPGQRIYSKFFPPSLQAYTPYKLHLQEKAQLQQELEQLFEELEQSGLSANTLLHLKLACRPFPEVREPSIYPAIERIQHRRSLPKKTIQQILALELKMAALNLQLDHLNYLYETKDYTIYDNDPVIQSELDFYEITSGRQIGEIGAGDEVFAAVVARKFPRMIYYINDIDTDLLDRISCRLQLLDIFEPPQHFVPIRGFAASTGMEGLELDAVIIRNAYHHFEQPEAMLLSIKRSLSAHGRLYIKEAFLEECEADCCEALQSREVILDGILQAGFTLIEERSVREDGKVWRLFSFEKLAE